MPLSLPNSPPDTSPMQELIQQSVFRFEAKLSSLGVLGFAKTMGLVEEYRKELEGVAKAADNLHGVKAMRHIQAFPEK